MFPNKPKTHIQNNLHTRKKVGQISNGKLANWLIFFLVLKANYSFEGYVFLVFKKYEY